MISLAMPNIKGRLLQSDGGIKKSVSRVTEAKKMDREKMIYSIIDLDRY